MPHRFELSKMNVKNKQRSVIKNSVVETVKLMHKVFTDEESSEDSTIFHWHKAFSKARETAALLLHVGRLLSIYTKETANTVIAVISEDFHITV